MYRDNPHGYEHTRYRHDICVLHLQGRLSPSQASPTTLGVTSVGLVVLSIMGNTHLAEIS